MAGTLYRLATPAEVALVAATKKTVLQIRPASNIPIVLASFWLSLDGVTSTNQPGIVKLLRQSADGTGSDATPVKADDRISQTLQAVAKYNFTAEPTTDGDLLHIHEVHPQGGGIEIPFLEPIVIASTDAVGITCEFAQAVNLVAGITFWE